MEEYQMTTSGPKRDSSEVDLPKLLSPTGLVTPLVNASLAIQVCPPWEKATTWREDYAKLPK
jgi:hypothetical protein